MIDQSKRVLAARPGVGPAREQFLDLNELDLDLRPPRRFCDFVEEVRQVGRLAEIDRDFGGDIGWITKRDQPAPRRVFSLVDDHDI